MVEQERAVIIMSHKNLKAMVKDSIQGCLHQWEVQYWVGWVAELMTSPEEGVMVAHIGVILWWVFMACRQKKSIILGASALLCLDTPLNRVPVSDYWDVS